VPPRLGNHAITKIGDVPHAMPSRSTLRFASRRSVTGLRRGANTPKWLQTRNSIWRVSA
jgi:hypothetical protein